MLGTGSSYAFYGAWDWRFLGLILRSTIVDYYVGLRLSQTEHDRRRRRLVIFSVFTNLGVLGVFKYAGFFADSFSQLMAAIGLTVRPFTLEVVLPVGISFYTFQTLSYTIDIYRRRLDPTPNFLDFALFVAFFPQLVAGPIERASRLLPQIVQPRYIGLEGIRAGSWLVLWGLFKKVVIGDNIATVVNAVYAPGASPEAPEVLSWRWIFLARYPRLLASASPADQRCPATRGRHRPVGAPNSHRHPWSAARDRRWLQPGEHGFRVEPLPGRQR